MGTTLLPLIDAVHVKVRPGVVRRETKTGVSWLVKWTVGKKADGKPNDRTKSYDTKAKAETFRKDLVTATGNRYRFDPTSGLPESMLQDEAAVTFLDLACEVVESEWGKSWSSNNNRARVEALAQLCAQLVDHARGKPNPELMRRWAQDQELPPVGWKIPPTRTKIRDRLVPVDEQERAADWMIAHSLPISVLADVVLIEDTLAAVGIKLDGTPFAPDVQQRQRSSLSLVCKRAVKRKLLATNPVRDADRKVDDESVEIDPDRVPSPAQARELVDAVSDISENARLQYRAYLTMSWTTGMRPSEVSGLHNDKYLYLPETGWGHLWARKPLVTPGKRWTNGQKAYETRDRLKARKRGAARKVLLPPETVAELRRHIEENKVKPGALLFTNSNGKPIDPSSMSKVWRKARVRACEAEFDELTVYQLRHTAGSYLLSSGISVPRVAEQLGNSPSTLMRVYARCLSSDDTEFQAKADAVLHPERAEDPRVAELEARLAAAEARVAELTRTQEPGELAG